MRFCTARDGVRLAYAVHGKGPPLVRVATWLSHLELDWESPVWRHWLKQLGDRHTVVRYDERGCGLSDANIGDPSVDVWVGDLETVIEAAGLERFALLGVSQAAAIRDALLARELDGSDVLARTSVPVLVSHGRDDMIVLPSMAERTLAACPAATLSWYDDVGHMPFWEAPGRFDRELAELARVARSAQPARPSPLWPLPRALTDGWRATGSRA